MTTTTTALPVPVSTDYGRPLGLPDFLVTSLLDPEGIPEPLHSALVELNARTVKARELRVRFEGMDQRAFDATLHADREADARAASNGTPNAEPTNTAGAFLVELRQVHHDADSWIRAANQAAYNVQGVIDANRDTITARLAPDTTTALPAAKAARAALDKLRPVLAALDHADALAAWVGALGTAAANMGNHRRPHPDDIGPRQSDLDAVLRALDELTP